MTDHRQKIEACLKAFGSAPVRQAALDLLGTLGYRSDKTVALEGSKPKAFLDFIAENNPDSGFDKKKALFAEWKSADLLFQLTDEEISREASLFQDTTVRPGLLRSYLFFAIELTGGDYARGKLTAIARQINRVFPMPVMVLIKHGGSDNPVDVSKQSSADNPVGVSKQSSADNHVGVSATLSIAVINRRQNKVRSDKDVLGKVTIIRDISLANPHRGHRDILNSFAFDNLVHPQKKPITDFDSLHAAWEEVFNVELLNKRFYKELANWYFWALPQVEFPADLEPDAEKRRATGLIRMLTRLIFCWFLKEKNLIPEKLFHPANLDKILKGFDPESETSSSYYQAILQNLFFATLNQRMGKDSSGKPYRKFATDEGFAKNRVTYDINNLFRYESLFAVPQEDALALFADIPFLNGGLFECLDQSSSDQCSSDNPVGVVRQCSSDNPVGVSPKKLYLDGFSRNPKKRPHVPDRLFFDSGETADLSEVYGDKKRKSEKVTGLITILNRYKFTIVENTPIDQEIALDPELLGKVFENLLASYNEETKTTARKQTGSFYTPRPIVEYMVDESLKAHLERKVAETILSRSSENVAETILSRSSAEDSEAGLPLLPYNPDAFTTITRANLPHWSQNGTTYWITFRLADSLPQEKLNAWKSERDIWMRLHPEPWDENQWKEYDDLFGKRLENWLDAGSGECHLRNPEVRAIVEKCLNHFDGDRYHLGPWVIMPNHVHLLLRPHDGQSLSKILKGIKGVSARECNAMLGRTGKSFWQEESFDHIVRSQAQFDRFVRYIAENPVKAKLRKGEYQSSRGNPAPVNQSSSDNPVGVAKQCSSDNPVGVAKQCSSDNPVGVGVHPDNTETRLSRLPSLRSRLDNLFSYTEEPHQFSETEVDTLITAIDQVKILDPACGSGAFPMGVLHKLVYILGKLDPDNERWKQTQLAKLDSAPMREELERAFADNNDDYGRKLYLIENCLYGVDIQPIAIQITKLRFFISLVCDQKIKSSSDNPVGVAKQSRSDNPVGVAKQSTSDNPVGVHSGNTDTRLSRLRSINLGIRPLPNLETKFVAANTLIGLPIPEPDLFIRAIIEPIEKEIEQAYHSHFAIQRRDQKLALQKKIKTLRQKLADIIVNGLGANKDSEIIKKAQHVADWDPFDPQSSADFFDPHWMFGQSLKDGFDIVIGNPPYVRIQMLAQADPKQPARLKEQYVSASKGNYDLYVVFVERGLQLLQPHGQLSYILPHKFFNAQYGEPLRKLLADGKNLRQVVHFGDEQIFPGATNYVCLLFLDKGGAEQCRWYRADDLPAWLQDNFAHESLLPATGFTAAEWNFAGSTSDALLAKLRRSGTRLLDLPAAMSRGHSTGDDDVFVIEATSTQVETEILRIPVFASDFKRYSYIPNSLWRVIFPYRERDGNVELMAEKELQREFPKTFRYLSERRDKLDQRKGARSWYGFTAPRNLSIHDRAQIFVPLLAEKGSFALIPPDLVGQLCPMASGGFTVSAASCPYRIEYLLGLLNSRPIFWILLRTSNLFRGGWITCTKQYFGELPIRPIDFTVAAERAQHDAIVSLVEHILAAKQADSAADTSALEREIDQQVYALYGLTPEEIAIVEGTSK